MQLAATDVKIDGDEMSIRLVPSRLPASLVASATLHALAFALAIRFLGSIAMPGELPRAEIIPVSLVSLPGGGGGAKGDGKAAPPPPTPPPAPVAAPPPVVPAVPPKPIPAERVAKKPPVKPRAQPAPPPVATAAAPAPAATDAGAASATGGGGPGRGAPGGGDGSGGDGSGGAHAAYGTNPKPLYPRAAQRLGIEGTVLLEVVVRPDGSPSKVSVRKSSGYRMLDDSAADTVRSRWRFIPARRDGMPVESTVTIPVVFRITEG